MREADRREIGDIHSEMMATRLNSSPPKRTEVLLAYYEGAYGPTIRIDVQSLESLAEIKAVFEKLS
jgi:hypothetical protein